MTMIWRKIWLKKNVKTIGLGSREISATSNVSWRFGVKVKEVNGKFFVNPHPILDDTWIQLFSDGTTSKRYIIWVKENGWDDEKIEEEK